MPRVAREHWRVVKQLTFDYWVWLIHELMALLLHLCSRMTAVVRQSRSAKTAAMEGCLR